MTAIVLLQTLADRIAKTAEGRARTTGGKGKGRDKSACHECRKSLTGLAFSRAWLSVVCRLRDFSPRFQCSGMHSGVAGLGWGYA